MPLLQRLHGSENRCNREKSRKAGVLAAWLEPCNLIVSIWARKSVRLYSLDKNKAKGINLVGVTCLRRLYGCENRWNCLLFKYDQKTFFFFRKKTYLAREKFDLAFFDMCNPRHIDSVIKSDRKIVCGRFGAVQPEFHFLAPVRLFVEFSYMRKLPLSCVA